MALGHPKGLFPLFFTEMWERLGFYLMVGILYLYIIDTERGGLAMSNAEAGEIYGTYLAFVYFTPFIGGMIADRYLGFRRSVLIGGVLMAVGYFALGVRSMPTFYSGLVLLCLGNGLFKPNISAMVGALYSAEDPKRDAGFNIFYMGINIGAAVSALLAAPLRNLWSFNLAFTAAGVGLLISVAILLSQWKSLEAADVPNKPSPEDVSMGQILLTIFLPAAVFGIGGYFIGSSVSAIAEGIGPITFAFLVGALPVLGYFVVLVRRATPDEKPGLTSLFPVYLAGGAFFMVLHLNGGLMTVYAESNTDRQAEWIPEATDFYAQKAMPSYYTNAGADLARPHPDTLVVVDAEAAAMFGARILKKSVVDGFENDPDGNLSVVTAEEASPGDQSLACKVYDDGIVAVVTAPDAHGVETTSVKLSDEGAEPDRTVVMMREVNGSRAPVILVAQETFDAVYKNTDAETPQLQAGTHLRLVNAEMLTAFPNPLFVVLLTPVVVAFFAFLRKRKRGLTTARKIFWGIVITTVAVLVMAGAAFAGDDGNQKTAMSWIILFYVIITVGELFLSPMGLSLVTKLSPKRLVGLMMGGWFLATAIGNKLSGFISGIEPSGMMFIIIAVCLAAVAGFLFLLLPKLDAAIKKYGA